MRMPECVRCGRRERAIIEGSPAYLCDQCISDPRARAETQLILDSAGGDSTKQRRVAVEEFGWHGGWLQR